MRTKRAVTILLTVFTVFVTGCTVRDAIDTSYLTPKRDIPSVEPVTVNPNDPGAPPNQTATQQAGFPPGQVTNTSPAAPPPAPATTSNLPAPQTLTSTPAPTTTASLPPPVVSQTSISFTPVIGAPIEAVKPLSRQLGTEARARGIVILQSGDANSTHILKGYFSAFTDGDKTTVGYVWDVLDPTGTRLHRIRGQEAAQGTAEDPWSVVQAATMETIAARTIADYLNWRSRAGG